MTDLISKALMEQVSAKVMAQLDIDDIVKKTIPKIEKELPSVIMNYFIDEGAFYEAFENMMRDSSFRKAMQSKIQKAVTAAFT